MMCAATGTLGGLTTGTMTDHAIIDLAMIIATLGGINNNLCVHVYNVCIYVCDYRSRDVTATLGGINVRVIYIYIYIHVYTYMCITYTYAMITAL